MKLYVSHNRLMDNIRIMSTNLLRLSDIYLGWSYKQNTMTICSIWRDSILSIYEFVTCMNLRVRLDYSPAAFHIRSSICLRWSHLTYRLMLKKSSDISSARILNVTFDLSLCCSDNNIVGTFPNIQFDQFKHRFRFISMNHLHWLKFLQIKSFL